MARKQQRTVLSTVVATIVGSGTASSLFWNGTPAPASVSSTQTYSYSFSSFLSGSLASGATITSVGVALPTGWSINSSARTLNYDGTGSAATTAGIVLRATNGSTTADSPIFSLTVVSSGVSPGSGTVTTIQLATTNIPGTYPFTVGAVFKKGDVPVSLVTDLNNYQVKIKRTWNDGSVKNAIISGRVTYTSSDVNPSAAGYLKIVTLSRGAYTEGTALAHANIVAANPSALVTCQGFGTVSLQTLLLSQPFRTWVSGPEMVECHYRGDVGGGSLLSVWFHVRLYADGRVWVRAIVENGYLDNGAGGLAPNADRTYIPTVTIGGTTVYTNGGASLLHCKNTRWMVDGWIGGDPLITPKHDVAYIKSTKLVPNYYWSNPSASALNSYVQTYTPMGYGNIFKTMNSAGHQPGLAYLPNWNAQYLASGDARAYRSTLANASSVNSWGIVWRSKTTNDVVKPSLMPDWNIYGNATILGSTPSNGRQVDSSNGTVWEKNHHPAEGYFAYLITGDYWHYETFLMTGSLLWLLSTPADGLGTSRNFIGTDFYNARAEPRGVGWTIRTWSLLAGIVPDADLASAGIGYEYRLVLSALMTRLKAIIDLPGINPLGQIFEAGFATLPDPSAGYSSHWMQSWWIASQGLGSEVEPFSDMTTYNAVRDWMYRFPVGLFGDATGYWFRYATTYWLKISTGDDEDPRTWASSWATVYNQTFANAPGGPSALVKSNTLATTTNTADTNPAIRYPASTDNNPDVIGVAGYLIAALSYAVDHGASGASAAWSRLINATNWSTFSAGFAELPQWGVAPRTVPAQAVPSWVASLPLWQWYQIPNTKLNSVPPSLPTAGNPAYKILAYNGATLRRSGSVYMLGAAGGHGDYAGNEVNAITLNSETPTWIERRAPTALPYVVDASQFFLTEPDGKARPSPTHTYNATQYIDSIDRMIVVASPGVGGAGTLSIPTAPTGWYPNTTPRYSFAYNYATNDWEIPEWVPAFPDPTSDFTRAMVAKHPSTGEIYTARDRAAIWKWTPSSSGGTWSTVSTNWRGQAYCSAAIDPNRNRMLVIGELAVSVGNPPNYGPQVWGLDGVKQTVTFGGLGSSPLTRTSWDEVIYDEANDCFLVFDNGDLTGGTIKVYRVDAATLVVSQPTVTGTAPLTRAPGAGLCNSIQYVPELKGFVFARAYDENLYFMRTAT